MLFILKISIELTADIPGKGALIWNLSGTVFTTPEGETGIYVSGRDVTEQRRAEEELRAKELQLVHSGRLSSLGEMATGIAHEMGGASFKVALPIMSKTIETRSMKTFLTSLFLCVSAVKGEEK